MRLAVKSNTRFWRSVTSKKRSASSQRWLKEHESDKFVKASRSDGYRSRAAYKLLELNERDQLFKSGMVVVDLGAAPGGWSQIAAQLVGEQGHVYALDILPMSPIYNCTVMQGDFLEQAVLDELLSHIDGNAVDLVISDMAPNMSGHNAVDQPRAMLLVELALDCATQILKPGGHFLAKAFQGEGFDAWVAVMKQSFKSVTIRKPSASRDRSREVYVLAKSYKV